MKRGVITTTLDWGHPPRRLFERMVSLMRVVFELMAEEYSTDEIIERFGDPVWVQSLGCVAGFDWNASGLTTTLMAAIKIAIEPMGDELGIAVCGGKGKTSLRTPEHIKKWGDRWGLSEQIVNRLIKTSRLTAKVDNNLIQDGFQIYHHNLIFDSRGNWAVIQQGMNTGIRRARRYHWANANQFLDDPHSAIHSTIALSKVLNVASKESAQNRTISLQWINNPTTVEKDIKLIENVQSRLSHKKTYKAKGLTLFESAVAPVEFKYHPVVKENFFLSPYVKKVLLRLARNQKPSSYIELLLKEGVGPAVVRALALTAEVIYGARPSYKDPARYTFAHGGKDGTPFPVAYATYDKTLSILSKAIRKAPVEDKSILNKNLNFVAQRILKGQ
ncbi:MAG: DUF763 domain-containing protein [Chlorobi bacterium]|nr:DUF763 domain-containing protein [Chlorobiota bacterium]